MGEKVALGYCRSPIIQRHDSSTKCATLDSKKIVTFAVGFYDHPIAPLYGPLSFHIYEIPEYLAKMVFVSGGALLARFHVILADMAARFGSSRRRLWRDLGARLREDFVQSLWKVVRVVLAIPPRRETATGSLERDVSH